MDAVRELVRRVASGTPIDAAVEGLDLGFNEHGRHASEMLAWVNWENPDPPRTIAHWMIEQGADAGTMLARAIEESVPTMIEVVLPRVAPGELGPALRAAFAKRRLAFARDLIARGADPSALDVVREDLVTPKVLEVSYRASADVQRVTFLVRFAVLGPAHQPEILAKHHGSALLRLGGGHLLASDIFDPAESNVEEESCDRRVIDGAHEIEYLLRVRSVSPAGLAMVLRMLVYTPRELYPVVLRVTGELSPNGDALSVDTARAERWFKDADADPIRPPQGVPFEVVSKPKKKTFAVVEHTPLIGRALAQAIGWISVESLGSPGVGLDVDIPAATEDLEAKFAETKTEIVLKHYAGPTRSDRSRERTLVLHACAGHRGVTSVRWCDDAGVASDTSTGEPKRKNEKKPSPKKPRRPSIMHPELGPSRIPELRALYRGRGSTPWDDAGAASSEVPESFAGAPVPPTLRAWLSYHDATWPLPRGASLAPTAFAALSESAAAFAPLEDQLFRGACVPLFVPSICADGTVLFLYLPYANDDGEAPVLGLDPTNDGLVGVFAPRFDHYLARVLGVDSAPYVFVDAPETAPYVNALATFAKLRAERGVLFVGALLDRR